jgi:hypothetical protein
VLLLIWVNMGLFSSFIVNFVIKTKQKKRASTLSKALLAAGLLGIVGYGNAAYAVDKTFLNQKIVVKADPPGGANPGSISQEETFIFDLVTDGSLTTVTRTGYTNPGTVTPINPNDPLAIRTDSNPLLTSEPYTFTGYKIKKILNGKRIENGIHTGDIKYREVPPYAGTNAEDVGVFNYAWQVPPKPVPVPPAVITYPTDLIAHDIPDDLWNPGGVSGAGFSLTPSLPSSALDNYVSFGGFGFDVYDVGTTTFDEPYQIFTVSKQPTGGNFQSLLPGDYAGCPGSCVGAKINQVPGPLPLLGVGAAFGFSRNLRKRIKGSTSPEVMSALG